MRTAKEITDLIMSKVDNKKSESVDGFKAGNPMWEVKGIVSTFTASIDVIKKAAQIGANLIITHEPTFYDHRDETDWLRSNEVYKNKYELIQKNEIIIWRFHDHWHLNKPDGICAGVIKELGWQHYIDSEKENVFNLPPITLKELSSTLKYKNSMPKVRVVGNPDMECRRVGMLVGAYPGSNQIRFLNDLNLDVLICGETVEWQTCEYVRDAVAEGFKKAVIVIGHANSEEAGMKYLVEWLIDNGVNVPITYIPAGDPFIYL